MMREKIILSLVALVIGAVFMEFMPVMFPSINTRFYRAGSQEYSIPENQKHLESSDSNQCLFRLVHGAKIFSMTEAMFITAGSS